MELGGGNPPVVHQPSGAFGWFMMLAVGAAYEVYAIKTGKVETLSTAFWRMSLHPIGGLCAVALWAAASHHLLLDNPSRRR